RAQGRSQASMSAQQDVLIAGAGLPGLAAACALARLGLSVALADRVAVGLSAVPATEEDWDVRVYAVSPGSAEFLRALGAWQRLPAERIAPIESMRIEGDAGAVLNFSAYELGERALAWIVEERALREALIPLVHAAGVATHAPAVFDALTFSRDAALLRLASGASIAARLVVGADGLRSWVRDAAGLSAQTRPYAQTAVVANFVCERAHRGRAYQWFRADGGVLAWLPLPGRRVSIVWSAPERLAQELAELAPEALAARVAGEGAHALGAFSPITPSAGFPLQSVKPSAVVAHRVALIGDAAHGVHPLAGQGANLGFGDVEALSVVLKERGPLDDAGAPILLERYARRRSEPVFAMHAVTDGLARLFGASAPWLRSARNLGMAGLDRLQTAKRMLAQAALR
ncbi:MAG TPA: FAD-dependent monooxygenase, partial [Casimicrobiaceae bacterium]|nr:FAD-dependent monooxygenase [Casimicrobiaceae bacterium]